MNYILLKDIANYKNQSILIRGWVFNFRSSGSIYFLELRDGSGAIQGIVSKEKVSSAVWANCEKLTMESSVEVSGQVTEHPKRPGVFELQIKDLKIIQIAEEYPIAKKEHGPDFLLDHRHLWLRSKRQWAILRLRDEIIWTWRNFFREAGFLCTDTPILTPTACEGTTTLFKTKYFDEPAYLAQSGQLYLEAITMSVGRAYDFGPTFRAEKSKTRRHLMEFWMLDAEMAFMDLNQSLDIQEKLICYTIKKVLANCRPELEILERDIAALEKIKSPFPRIKYEEAIKQLQQAGSRIKFGDDLGGDDETLLSKKFDRPVFITHYPAKIKPFYMKIDPQNPDLVLNADCLAPEGYGEIIGGSQREDDCQILEQRMNEHKISLQDYQWYLDLRRYGSVSHSGFGIGLERTVGWLGGLPHVRETIPFPRLLNRLRP